MIEFSLLDGIDGDLNNDDPLMNDGNDDCNGIKSWKVEDEDVVRWK